jgi:DNA polymerase-1
LASRLLLQVHDELILEVPSEEIEGIKDLVQTEMPAALKMTVPLRVAVKLGSNWGALE